MRTAKSVGYTMFEGTGEHSVAQAASNIASLLAQCKWESASWTACDENWWNTASPQGACSQRPDNSLYHDLTGPDACPVDPNMRMTAVTKASWAKQVECSPDSGDFPAGTRKCCWWGRGVIQTTGVCNFGKLNYYIGKRAADEGRSALYPSIDFCKNPGKICSQDGPKELKWIAGLFYWLNAVQPYEQGGWNYLAELKKWVDGGMNLADTSFINGASGIVNRGCHNPPNCGTGELHGGANRIAHFKTVLEAVGAI